jgi:hypothetical protein
MVVVRLELLRGWSEAWRIIFEYWKKFIKLSSWITLINKRLDKYRLIFKKNDWLRIIDSNFIIFNLIKF